jgi:hypothetical protein
VVARDVATSRRFDAVSLAGLAPHRRLEQPSETRPLTLLRSFRRCLGRRWAASLGS